MLEKHLRRPAVEEITGLKRSAIYDLMARGEFPRPIKLTGKAVAWPESAIRQWLENRVRANTDLPPRVMEEGVACQSAGRRQCSADQWGK